MIGNIRNFHFYKNGNSFYGSHEGMRFAIDVKKDEEDKKYLAVDAWPDRFSREKTEDELHIKENFDFSQDGLDQIKAWLTALHEEKAELWKSAVETPFV